MSRRSLTTLLPLALLMLGISVPSAHGGHAAFAETDLFVGVGGSKVQWRDSGGSLHRTMATAAASPQTTGMAFSASGNLMVTGYTSNAISAFSSAGQSAGTFGSGFSSHPESIAFDASGNAFVGQESGSRDILKFGPGGNLIATFDAAPDGKKGTDRLDLASDQCTVFYTGQGKAVRRYDACAGQQLSDLTTSLPGKEAYDVKILPDGGALVADEETVVRVSPIGAVAQQYDIAGRNCWTALALDATAASFWAGDRCSSDVVRFDLTTGGVLGSFNAGSKTSVQGLAVKGGFTAANAGADLAIDKTDAPDPVSRGAIVRYDLAVTNNGPMATDGVVVTDELPADVSFRADLSTPGCVEGPPGTVTCAMGSLAAGAGATATIRADVSATPQAGELTDTATVTGDENDPVAANNTDTEITSFTEGDAFATECIVSEGCSGTTGSGVNPSDNTVTQVFVPPDPNAQNSVLSISDSSTVLLVCGPENTSQTSIVDPPSGYANRLNPIRVTIIVHPTTGITAVPRPVCTAVDLNGDGDFEDEGEVIVIPPCPQAGQGEPSVRIGNDQTKCVHKQQLLPNGNVQSQLLILSGDPPFRH